MDHIGIDVHKASTQVCIQGADGELQEFRIPTTRDRLIETFGAMAPGKVLLEASTESEWVARCLERVGHEVVVADPGFAPMYATRSRKVKTDRRDARCLAEACQLGAYRAAHRTSDASRHLRDLVLARKLQVRMRSQTIVTLRSILRREGFRLRSGGVASFRTRLEELEVTAETAEVMAPLLDLIDTLTASIKQAERGVADQLALHPRAARLTTVPGIGPVTAITFHATMDDSSRFASARAVRAYLGLVPSERSSGEKRQLGHITKRGQTELRSLLVEAAWRIVRSTSDDTLAMRNWAAGITARRGRAIAVVALARKLAGVLFVMWRDEHDFAPRRTNTQPPRPLAASAA